MNRIKLPIIVLTSIVGCLLIFSVARWNRPNIKCNIDPTEVDNRIQAYFINKYPAYAELNASTYSLGTLNRIAELQKICPVDRVDSSFTYGPFVTFVERTEKSDTEVTVTYVRLYGLYAGKNTCSIRIRVRTEEKQKDFGYSSLDPVTEDEIRILVENGKGSSGGVRGVLGSDRD